MSSRGHLRALWDRVDGKDGCRLEARGCVVEEGEGGGEGGKPDSVAPTLGHVSSDAPVKRPERSSSAGSRLGRLEAHSMWANGELLRVLPPALLLGEAWLERPDVHWLYDQSSAKIAAAQRRAEKWRR
mmetsp:Transcript_11993/g.36550  ORF Transcript_11993/g.36550 Transcript_11993/m.36550 type:complete len:128 (-) Transcript_11993:880-1263(-)